MFEGRYVLIGGDINDLDDYATPMTRFTGRMMKGLEVHAHMLAQQLDGRMPAADPGLGPVAGGGRCSSPWARSPARSSCAAGG